MRVDSRGLFGDDVKDDRLVEGLEMFEGADQQQQIVAINGPVVAQAEFLEEHVREEQVFRAFLDFVGEGAGGFACDFFDEIRSFRADGGKGVVGLEIGEVAGDRADVFIDRPFVVVEDDDEFAGGFRDVVERFEGGAAGECGVSGDGDDVIIAAGEVAGGGHAEGGGEGCAGMACAVGIMLGFRAQEETVEAFVGADRVDLIRATGEHFVNVSLVGDVEDKLVVRRGEHLMEGDGQLDDAQIGTEVAAGFREGGDERVPDFRGKIDQFPVGEFFDIAGRMDGLEERAKGGRLRKGGCHRRRRRDHPACRTVGKVLGSLRNWWGWRVPIRFYCGE